MTIIYADDDPEDRELFSDALKEVRPEVKLVLASHGKEVINFLQSASELPDYIFLDINMPVMGGKDCLRKLKEIDEVREIPVIMYTTTSNKDELKKYIDMGAHDYVVKDASFQGIKNSLRKVITKFPNE
jgi:CheY-like chemotaxis protein